MHVYTRLELAAGQLPPSEFGNLIAHSYSPNGGWYVMIIPEAFQMEQYTPGGTNHFTPYSYDRHVPLAFFGAPFTPGTYHGRVEPVDLAATLASLLGINQPSASVGHILTQAVHPATVAPVVKPTRHVRAEPLTDSTKGVTAH
jgi:arylsulfatase A-like enzyme